MTKKSLISLSIFVVLIVLIGVLFGTVFCLRTQNVTFLGETPVEISREEIITTANLKNGQSIFMLDKDSAIHNIESTYPKVKVVQIQTVGLTEINIKVRARHEMYYTEFASNYYILDEDLKILSIVEKVLDEDEQPTNEPTSLIHIEEDVLNINSSTKKCDFVGSSYQKQVVYGLYTAMTTTVTKMVGEDEVYYDRNDIKNALKSVEFEEYDTFNKIIIKTNYGVELDIENPTQNLQTKINICFSTIEEFIKLANDKEKSGTIKIFYELDNSMKTIYIAENSGTV